MASHSFLFHFAHIQSAFQHGCINIVEISAGTSRQSLQKPYLAKQMPMAKATTHTSHSN